MSTLRSRGIIAAAALALLALPSLPSHAQAQDASATIQHARETLGQIGALLDSALSRESARGSRTAAAPDSAEWVNLFDGKSLAGWKRTDFPAGGDVKVEQSFRGGPAAIVVQSGESLSGLSYTGDVPRTNYEVQLNFMKIEGYDFACGLTFPVGDSYASLILGGWSGGVVGISSIDGMDASENETTKYIVFPKDRWFHVRLRVTTARLEAWLDDRKVVDVKIAGRKISLRPGPISMSRPLGLATYQTSAAFRAIRLRRL